MRSIQKLSQMSIEDMFRAGYDTLEIANLTRQTEAEVCNKLHRIRSYHHRAEQVRAYNRNYARRQRAAERMPAE